MDRRGHNAGGGIPDSPRGGAQKGVAGRPRAVRRARPPNPDRKRLGRAQRLTGRGGFQGVFKTGRRNGTKGLLLISAPRPRQPARLGISVAKKQVRRAVDRNRIRRIIRESFRHAQGRLRGLDLVVVVWQASQEFDDKTLRKKLDPLWDRASPCETHC